MDAIKSGADVFFVLIGAVMVLAMHCGFAFLEVGTVWKKNQVNALVKIIVDLSVSTVVYFFTGYGNKKLFSMYLISLPLSIILYQSKIMEK